MTSFMKVLRSAHTLGGGGGGTDREELLDVLGVLLPDNRSPRQREKTTHQDFKTAQ